MNDLRMFDLEVVGRVLVGGEVWWVWVEVFESSGEGGDCVVVGEVVDGVDVDLVVGGGLLGGYCGEGGGVDKECVRGWGVIGVGFKYGVFLVFEGIVCYG